MLVAMVVTVPMSLFLTMAVTMPLIIMANSIPTRLHILLAASMPVALLRPDVSPCAYHCSSSRCTPSLHD